MNPAVVIGENWKAPTRLAATIYWAAKVLDKAHDKIVELQQGHAR